MLLLDGIHYLSNFSLFYCSFSVVIILASLAGPTAWIQTEERIPISHINASYKNAQNLSYIIKTSNASLWILCTRQGKFYTWKKATRHFGLAQFGDRMEIIYFLEHN
jgi:hypothetical protein